MGVLKELANVRQVPGEPRRRWFQSAQEDLIVWYANDDSILGFQLCYDRHRQERAFTWRRGRGFIHERVDDGEEEGLTYKRMPMLMPDGKFDALATLELFEAGAAELPTEVREFVRAKLREYDERRA